MTGVEHSAPNTVGWVSVAPPTLEEHSASTDDCSDSEPTGHDSELPMECSPGMASTERTETSGAGVPVASSRVCDSPDDQTFWSPHCRPVSMEPRPEHRNLCGSALGREHWTSSRTGEAPRQTDGLL